VNDVEKAIQLFRTGCVCSQALLGVYGPRYGLDPEQALRLAAGFGSGMRRAETCGALTGAFMVLGLARCDGKAAQSREGRAAASDAVVAFAEAFEQRHGSLRCRDLLGCDVSTPEGHRTAMGRGLFQTRCVELVRDAAQLLEEALKPRDADPGPPATESGPSNAG